MSEDDNNPKWLKDLIRVPPPLVTVEERARQERRDRGFAARELVTRIPELGGLASTSTIAARIHHPELVRWAGEWAPGAGSAVLLGESGLGKTSAVALAIRRLFAVAVREGGAAWAMAQGVAWIRAQDLERDVKSHPLGKGVPRLLAAAQSATLLVFDDIGWEGDPRTITEVYAERYDRVRPTITTSGRDLDQLRDLYSEAVVRRMTTHRGRLGRIVRAFPQRDAEDARNKAGLRAVGAPPVAFNERGER